jgi:hypothetical protein
MTDTKAKITTEFTCDNFTLTGNFLILHLVDASIVFPLDGLIPDMNKPVKLTAEIELAKPQGSSE